MTTLEQFAELVADVYDAALDPALWEKTLRQIAAAAGGEVGALCVNDRQRPPRSQFITVNLDPIPKRNYEEYYGRLNPLTPILARTPVGVIVSCRAHTTDATRRGEFYTDWVRPSELGDDALGVNILDSADGSCALYIAPPSRSDLFATPEEQRLVRLLVPHLQRAMQAQLRFGLMSQVRDGALDLVDQWRHGCVHVSFLGRVVHANRAANDIVATRDGLSLGTRGLRASVASEDAALQRLIRQACTSNGESIRAGGRLAISRDSGCKPFTVQVMPLRSSHAQFLGGPAAAMVLIVDHEHEAHLPPEDLQRLYDLTPAEAEVALRVLRGHGLQYVADELRVTLSTVRVHLQRVFEKTGTHRQAELVRMLIELATTKMPDGRAETGPEKSARRASARRRT